MIYKGLYCAILYNTIQYDTFFILHYLFRFVLLQKQVIASELYSKEASEWRLGDRGIIYLYKAARNG